MSLYLPPPDSELRNHIDVKQLASLGTQEGLDKLPAFSLAVDRARATMRESKGIAAMHMLVKRNTGAVWLVRISPKTSAKLWDFGVPFAGAR